LKCSPENASFVRVLPASGFFARPLFCLGLPILQEMIQVGLL
jgi:hypothetical protein